MLLVMTRYFKKCGSSLMVEHYLTKAQAPNFYRVFRSMKYIELGSYCWVFCICLVFDRYLWYHMGYGLI